MDREVLIQCGSGAPADFRVPCFLIMAQALTGLLIERRKQVERDVCRLVMTGIRSGDVGRQRPERSLTRKRPRLLAREKCRRIAPGKESGGDRLDITFNAGDLSGKEYFRTGFQLQRRSEQTRRVYVSVAVDLTVAHEFRFRPTRNQAKHARLLTELQVILEADQIVAFRAKIFLPQLYD